MIRRFVVRAEARLEMLEATNWYSERSRDLGVEFVRVIDEAFSSIQENPLRFPIVDDPVRMGVVRPFPYTILFTADEAEVVILSVFHARRDPTGWKTRK